MALHFEPATAKKLFKSAHIAALRVIWTEMLRRPAYAEASFAVICLFLEPVWLVSDSWPRRHPRNSACPSGATVAGCDANGIV